MDLPFSPTGVSIRNQAGIGSVSDRLTPLPGIVTMEAVQIGVLGPLTVEDDDTTSPRDRVVLEALALRNGRPIPASVLADALWGDDPPASWRKVVQGCVVRLRQQLGTAVIQTTPTGYRLEVSAAELDAFRFERLVGRSRELLVVGESALAVHAATNALTLWRGRPYSDLEDWDEARIERARLDELRLDAEELAVEAALMAGHHRSVLPRAQALAEQQPLRERRWALLARAEYQAARQAEALRTIGRARRFLQSEVGLDPGAELCDLEAAILRQDPALDVTPGDSSTGNLCPYQGLAPYDIDDDERFFGRESVVDECLRILRTQRVLAVVGPSGSGKSSLVRAGIASALRADGSRVRIVSPRLIPPGSLSKDLLADVDVLVVDQFEEAMAPLEQSSTQALLDDIATFAVDGQVILALRADRLGEVSRHAEVARLIERGMHLLRAMNEPDLRSAIEGPAHRSGFLLETGLVDLLVREVEGEPGALPMMSHSLRGTWERREGRVLTIAGYRSTGGLRGAVARSAEELYATLTDQQRALTHELMLRMVTPTLDGDPVSSPIPRRSVTADRHHATVIEMLVDSRLVTSDGETVELAHEALVRAWPRLRSWLDEDVEGQRILRHLTVSADSWTEMGRPDSELYRGGRLRAALEWRDRTDHTLTPPEHAFLDAGRETADREADAAVRQARRQAKVNRQLRALLTGAVVLMLIAAVAGVLAARSADRARRQAGAVEMARGRALAGLALNEVSRDRSLALLLAVEAARVADSPAARGALATALFEQPFRRTSIATPATDHMAVGVDAGGTLAVAKRADGLLDVIDLRTRSVRFAGLPSPPSPVGGVDIDRSGTMAVSSGVPTPLGTIVYDLDSGREIVRIPNDDAFFRLARFSPDADVLSVADGLGIVRLYDTTSWQEIDVLDTGLRAPVSATAFDATGSRLFVATIDPFVATGLARLVALDTETGEVVAGPSDTGETLVSSIVIGPDDDEVLLAGRWIERRATDSLERLGERFGESKADGLVTLAAGADGTVVAGSPVELQVFADVESAQPPTATLHEQGAPGAAFVGDGATLITADIDGAISTWSVIAHNDVGRGLLPPMRGQVSASSDRASLVVWDDADGVAIYERESLQRRSLLEVAPGDRVVGVDTDQSGERLVTLTCPPDPSRCVAALDVWDISSGLRLAGPETIGDVWPGLRRGVVFTRGDEQVVTALGTGVVGFWDAITLDSAPGRPKLSDHTAVGGQGTWAVASTETNGRSLLAAHDELGQTVVWDVTDGQTNLIGALENAYRMDFDPTGRLITSSGPGSIVVRDPFTLEPVGDVMPGPAPADTFEVADTGLMVASGDHGLVLWDLDGEGALTGTIPGVRSTISQDGWTLYLGSDSSGSSDVRALSMRSDDLIQEACDRAGRNLTIAEWNRTLGTGESYRATCPHWPSEQL